jgi:lipopolysaccharide/colanic/teichoic acid biosynthesis glycosyltransferase
MRVSVKRLLDLIGAVVALVLLLPLLLAIAVAVASTSRGPVLVQSRMCGSDQQTFWVLRFRTTVWPPSTALSAQSTAVGRFLRKYGLYKLPMLINVISGEMTLTGQPFGEDADTRQSASDYSPE